MSELIDRQDVIDRLKKAEDVFRQNGAKLEANGIHYALELVESDIEIPTIEPRKERPHGKWHHSGECSVCHKRHFRTTPLGDIIGIEFTDFCPNCGAKMEVDNADKKV